MDPNVNFAETFADMTERDRRDSTRADSPLKAADDAIIVDSTGLSIQEVFEQMMAAVQSEKSSLTCMKLSQFSFKREPMWILDVLAWSGSL